MALFGRETQADQARADRVKAWAQARSPMALFSGMFGLLALVDSITGVLGVVFGVIAIVLGVRGRRELAANPSLKGHRLCHMGLVLGTLGLVIGGWLWWSRF